MLMEGSMKSFVIDGSERSVQDIVSKLKFISKIKEGEKVDVQSLTLCESGLGTSLYRTFVARGESRENALEFIRSIILEGFNLASKYLKKPEKFLKDIGKMIIDALHESRAGLVNLTKTYQADRMYVSKVETLMSTLETKTCDLQRQLLQKNPPPKPIRSPLKEPKPEVPSDKLFTGDNKVPSRPSRRY